MSEKQPFPTPGSRFVFHVSYGETDMMQVAYYGNYLHWFERARGQFIRERGMSYLKVEEKGAMLPVIEAHVRYKKPARYDDEIAVRVGISEWKRASLTFVYEVYGPPEQSTLLATGFTRHAVVAPSGKPIAVPDWLRSMF